MQIVKRAIDLIRLLRHHEQLSLKVISESLGVTPNSGWNLLDSLCQCGAVHKVASGSYALTREFSQFSGDSQKELFPKIRPIMRELAGNLKESAVAVVISGSELQIACDMPHHQDLMVSNRIYQKQDALYRWATGRVLLAWQTPFVQKSIIRKKGLPNPGIWPGISSNDEFLKVLESIREETTVIKEAGNSYVASFASPVFDKAKHFLMAIGISCPSARLSSVHKEAIYSHLQLSALKIGEIQNF